MISPRSHNEAACLFPARFCKASEVPQLPAVRCETGANTTPIHGPALGRDDLKKIDKAKGWAEIMQTGDVDSRIDHAGTEP